MIEKYKYNGKTLEEALNNCYADLNLSINDIYYIENQIEGKLFKSKKIEIEVIKKESLIDYLKNFIETIAKYMNLNINYEIKEVDNYFNILLISDNNALLIGKDGKNLNAIQIVLRQAIKNLGNYNIKIAIDASNYRAKKINNLEREIKKIAKEVLATKVDVKLDPMNSYERRIVHKIVNEFNNLQTESIGESPERYVTIKYIEK
ncbi:MAG: R3H domain-containing nucleic acid-binding protein [Bacilli bacterium]